MTGRTAALRSERGSQRDCCIGRGSGLAVVARWLGRRPGSSLGEWSLGSGGDGVLLSLLKRSQLAPVANPRRTPLPIVDWIERTYNRRRRQRRLGKLTSVESELAFTPAEAQAAA